MIDKIARAIEAAYDGYDVSTRGASLLAAIAAVEALRDPSGKMVEAAYQANKGELRKTGVAHTDVIYTAMIDAILNETP